MTTMPHREHRMSAGEGDPSLGRSWLAVVAIPAFFLGSMIVAQVLYAVLGYKPENDDAPLWADLVAALPALVVFLVPCAAAVVFGRRAAAGGARSGLGAAALGAVAGVAFTVLSVVTIIAGELR